MLALVGFGAVSRAQEVPPVSPEIQAKLAEFQARIDETAGTLAREPQLRRWSPKQRQTLVEFVVGNLLFVATHELGHAVVSEFDLPILGREENAADDFAILTALRVVANDFSERVLVKPPWTGS